MTQTQAPPAVVLCPFWVRFFQRGDGEWMAHCSESACDQLDLERSDWRERFEMERSETCGLGWGKVSGVMPCVITRTVMNGGGQEALWNAHLLRAGFPEGQVTPPTLTDEQWGRYIEAFLAWTPPQVQR